MSGKEIGMVLVLAGIIMLVGMAPHPMDQKHYEECINGVAYQAYVIADVGDTFDAGFNAGLLAAEKCK